MTDWEKKNTFCLRTGVTLWVIVLGDDENDDGEEEEK